MNTSIFNDAEYKTWIPQLKVDFRKAHLKAAIKVNTDLLNYYWYLGKDIIKKQVVSNWGMH